MALPKDTEQWSANLSSLLVESKARMTKADSLVELESIRVSLLGKKGALTEYFKQLKSLSVDQKKTVGVVLNGTREQLVKAIESRREALQDQAMAQALQAEALDMTLPGRGQALGGLHPVSVVSDQVLSLFSGMGFDVVTGPEIESEYYNFTALNMPSNHPARAMHDTFYISDDHLLRTHTSTMQIRALADHKPPIRMVGAGRVFRSDYDQTHTPMFHQMEGLVIVRGINFCQLKTLLTLFLQQLFSDQVVIRFRPSYFPFTEPSAEVDIQVKQAGKEDRWLEVLGCGMVHPNVLQMAGLDHEVYQGFAFGMGLDRLAMILYGIDDLRSLFVNDLDFLQQFNDGV
jgi:phenylalanyl-tRNA synthetase alpha chain